MTTNDTVPNHHAHHPPFRGPTGFLMALTMLGGRGRDSALAARLGRLAPGELVVDVGCGPGSAARYAADQGASVVGVDPAPVMLRVARALGDGRGAIRYAEGSAEHLPVDDGAASAVWSIACVHHWDDIDAGLSEARRVLRPGGRLVAIERRTEPGADGLASHGWTEAQAEAFADACRARGFGEVEVHRNEHVRRGPALAVVAER